MITSGTVDETGLGFLDIAALPNFAKISNFLAESLQQVICHFSTFFSRSFFSLKEFT